MPEELTQEEICRFMSRMGRAHRKHMMKIAREAAGPNASDELIAELTKMPKVHISIYSGSAVLADILESELEPEKEEE